MAGLGVAGKQTVKGKTKMANIVTSLKNGGGALAPSSIDLNSNVQTVEAATFKRDSKLHDLRTDFIRKRDAIQEAFLKEVSEVSSSD